MPGSKGIYIYMFVLMDTSTNIFQIQHCRLSQQILLTSASQTLIPDRIHYDTLIRLHVYYTLPTLDFHDPQDPHPLHPLAEFCVQLIVTIL